MYVPTCFTRWKIPRTSTRSPSLIAGVPKVKTFTDSPWSESLNARRDFRESIEQSLRIALPHVRRRGGESRWTQRREHDHGNVGDRRIGLLRFTEGVAVHNGHREVENDDSRPKAVTEKRQGFGAVVRGNDTVTAKRQQADASRSSIAFSFACRTRSPDGILSFIDLRRGAGVPDERPIQRR